MLETRRAYKGEDKQLLEIEEDHFHDIKSKRIKPSKLQETFIAFANTDGGELYIGIEDHKCKSDRMSGFARKEDANDLIHTLLEETEPSVESVDCEFIHMKGKGYMLYISIPKSPKVHYAADKKCFVRINARNKEIRGDKITQLSYSKGFLPYEKKPIEVAQAEDYVDSSKLKNYMERIGSKLDPAIFLRKQRLLSPRDSKMLPNACCVLLFDEEPQATLDTRCSIKVYRLKTSTEEYRRELLAAEPATITGSVEDQIAYSKEMVAQLLKDASIFVDGKLRKFKYPPEAIHEILVNAVIHRDYSLNDDIHIRIYDNRIEIMSPGKLPGYITLKNIYEERFSRNPNLVRMLHKLPDPVNRDIGEGLDTAKHLMIRAGLIEPIIEERGNSVVVTIKHEQIATLEDIILNHLKTNETINNKIVRELSGNNDINKVKKSLKRLRDKGVLELVDEHASIFDYKYRLKK